MENLFELPPSFQEHVEERLQNTQQAQQHSQLVAELLSDKNLLAENAITQFTNWDADRSGAISNEELNDVYISASSSPSDRATADILKQNIQSASTLVESSFNHFSQKYNDLSRNGGHHLNSVFAGDWFDSPGISRRDLSAITMLSSDSGRQKFLEDAQSAEKYSIANDAALTGVGGSLALSELGLLIISRGKLGSRTALAIGSLIAGIGGESLVDSLKHNDTSEIDAQFNRRKSMLDSWEMPV